MNNRHLIINKMEVAIIILNYKTWRMTLQLIDNIKKINEMKNVDIIVVDNNSPNDSAKKLMKEKEKSDNFVVLISEKNAGYAAGNNIGLRYAFEKGYKYAWILNNDVEVQDKDILNKMLVTFRENENIAAVSPDIVFPNGYIANRDLVRPNIYDMTIGAIQYKKKGRESNINTNWSYSYRPQGCCMVLDLKKMNEIGYMDEYTFLYCEEPILAEKLLEKGYRCACCLTGNVIHNHSYTVKSSLSKLKFIRTNLRSFDYLIKKYRKFNCISRIYCDIFYVLRLIVTKQV